MMKKDRLYQCTIANPVYINMIDYTNYSAEFGRITRPH